MKSLFSIIVLLLVSAMAHAQDDEWVLIWSDEFDYEGVPDPEKWDYDIGGHGWGNNELQYYTEREDNARVEEGKLIITAQLESYEGNRYTSARIVSRDRGDWRYGRFEVRAKLPRGTGTWPAIWMLPTDWEYGGWPTSGEIDIMEHVGYDLGKVHGTVHTDAYNHQLNTQRGGSWQDATVVDEFKTYIIEWTPESIIWWVDDRRYYTFNNERKSFREWPFDKRFHFLLNIAIGGSWGGVEGVDDSIFPQTMEIEYVRVYATEEILSLQDEEWPTEWKVYPNPTTEGIWQIHAPGLDTHDSKLMLTDMLGKEIPVRVSPLQGDLYQIQAEELVPGIYQLLIHDGATRMSYRVVNH